MIQRLTESFISGVELLETECRLAKFHVAELVIGALALAAFGAIGVLATIALLVGMAIWLAPAVGLGAALVVSGGAGFAMSAWGAQRIAGRLREGEGAS